MTKKKPDRTEGMSPQASGGDRWVVLARADDEVWVIGPKENHTYPSAEKARLDADHIAHRFISVDVQRVRGILEADDYDLPTP